MASTDRTEPPNDDGSAGEESWAELDRPGWWRAAFLLFLAGASSNLVLTASHPPESVNVGALIAAIGGRGLLFTWIAVATLRRRTSSPRRPWMPDGAFAFFAAVGVLFAYATVALTPALDGFSAPTAMFFQTAFGVLLAMPTAPWLVAIAVERPLGASPAPFLRAAHLWLLPLLAVTLVLLLPLRFVEALAFVALFSVRVGAVELALLAAAVSAASTGLNLALALVAYRAVAKG